MALKVNDRVRVTGLKVTGKYEKTVGKRGIIKRTFMDKKHHLIYGVILDDLTNYASKDGLFWFGEGEIEIIPTLNQIKEEKMRCVIHTPTKEDVIYILDRLDYSTVSPSKDRAWVDEAFKHIGNNLCLYISRGEVSNYDSIKFYKQAPERFMHIYEAKDIFKIYHTEQDNDCTNSYEFKVGDKVRIKKDLPECEEVNGLFVSSVMYKHRGKEAIVTNVSVSGNFQLFRLNTEDCTDCLWNSEMVDLISEAPTNNIPTLSTIISEKHNCVIHTTTKEQAKKLFGRLTTNEDVYKTALVCWDVYKKNTCYVIENGKYRGYQRISYFVDDTIYEFEDVYDRKENNNMSNVPTFKEIVDKELECIIHTPTKELARVLFDNIKPFSNYTLDWIDYWDGYKKETCYVVRNKEINGYSDYTFYTTDEYFKHLPIYEIEDIICASKSNKSNKHNVIKEEKKMNKTFEVIKGTRPNTNKGETGYIDTITTIAYTPRGRSAVTCDASDYDVYTGALVASAKIVAKSNSNASMMYNMAIELWGTDTSKSILHALANEAFKGYFDNNYTRWQKSVAYQKRLEEEATRTCPICGKVFKTVKQKEKHIKWHEDCKAHREAKKLERMERREARYRLAEMQSEGRIEKYMEELVAKNKTTKKTVNKVVDETTNVDSTPSQEDNSTPENVE